MSFAAEDADSLAVLASDHDFSIDTEIELSEMNSNSAATPILRRSSASDEGVGGSAVLDGAVGADTAAEGTAAEGKPYSEGAVVFNLANSTIGVGVLGLPYVLRVCGVALGLVLVALAALLADYTLRLLHRCFVLSKQPAYEKIGEHLFGQKGGIAVKVMVIGINLGALIGYQIVLGDLLHPVIQLFFPQSSESFWLQRNTIITIVVLFVIGPLCLPRQIGSLKWTSLLSLGLVLLFTVIVVYKCFVGGFGGNIVWVRFSPEMFLVFGVVVFAFACHTNLVPVVSELENAHQRRVPRSIHISVGFVLAIYLVVMNFGYLTFYEKTEGDLTLGYDSTDIVVGVFRSLLAVTVILTTPLTMYPCRVSVDYLLFPNNRTSHANLRFYLETAVILGLTWLLAILLPSVELIFNLTGAAFSSFTAYIFPGVFYLKLRGVRISRHTIATPDVLFPLLIIGVGCLTAILGTVSQIVDVSVNGV